MTLVSRRERAERAILDAAAVIPLPLHKLIERHNHALAAVRALWVSRRKWRAVALGLEQENANLNAAFRAALAEEGDIRILRIRVAELEAQLNGGAQ